jgi:putative membrane protein
MKKSLFGSLKLMLKGLVVGSSMLLPGVSGGTMAIILGIYDRLIKSLSNIFKDFKRSVIYLILFAAGAGLGFLLFARLISAALEIDFLADPLHYLFLGAVVGTIPLIFVCATRNVQQGKKEFGILDAVMILIGFLLLLPVRFIPENLFVMDSSLGFNDLLLLFAAGLVLSVALVLPGISVSFTMYVFGIYESTLNALKNLDVVFLLPLALGLVIGTFATAALLDKALTRFTRQSYLIIGGFVLASVTELFPGIPSDGLQIAICIATTIAGFLITFSLGKLNKE